MKMFYIYFHYRLDTDNVFYVGKGAGYRANSKSGRNKHWHNIVNKCGYRVEIIKDNLSEKEAFDLEISYIKSYGLNNLANMSVGGEGASGVVRTDKQKDHLRKINTGKLNPNYGIKRSKETIELIRLGNIGKSCTKEVKLKLSASAKNRTIIPENESVRRLGISKGLSKSVEQLTLTGEVLGSFYGTREARRVTGIAHIPEVCNGKRATAGGFKWRYS